MKVYRLTFETSIIVACDNKKQAESIGRHHLIDEVRNGHSHISSIEHIKQLTDLHSDEKHSYPWTAVFPVERLLTDRKISEIIEDEHSELCSWHQDWHACDCGKFA